MTDTDDNMTLVPIDPARHPPSEACLSFMAEQGFDPEMPVYRLEVTTGFMMKTKAARPEVDNTLQLLTGPFGVVDPLPTMEPFRVAELRVGGVLLDVEAEYEYKTGR